MQRIICLTRKTVIPVGRILASLLTLACLKLRPTMIHFEARGKVAASNSTNTVSFSSELNNEPLSVAAMCV